MIVTFLGTGTSAGIPLIGCKCEVCTSSDPRDKRLRTSILIETQGKTFVIDSGPDFRQQMLRENVENLDGLIFTHEHIDHVAGLDDVRGFNFMMRKEINAYVSENVEVALRRVFPYIFAEKRYPGAPRVNLIRIENKPFQVEGVAFVPIQVMHYKLPVFGFRVGDLTYITDASSITEEEKEKVRGSKVIVLNALRKEEHIAHWTFDNAVKLMTELAPERGYFIHASHQLGKHADIEKELPVFIKQSYDGLKIEV